MIMVTKRQIRLYWEHLTLVVVKVQFLFISMLKGKKMIPLVTHEPLYQYIFQILDRDFKTFYVYSREKWPQTGKVVLGLQRYGLDINFTQCLNIQSGKQEIGARRQFEFVKWTGNRLLCKIFPMCCFIFFVCQLCLIGLNKEKTSSWQKVTVFFFCSHLNEKTVKKQVFNGSKSTRLTLNGFFRQIRRKHGLASSS